MKKTLFGIIGLSALLAASCNKDDGGGTNEPAVVACADPSTDSAVANESIKFRSCSQNAAFFAWDFGDGNTSADSAPVHKYASKGTYTVKMTATSPLKTKSASRTFKVFIGERYIKGVRVNGINFKNNSGADWDADGGPDMFISFYPESDLSKITGSTVTDNVTQSMLPITYGQWDVKATEEPWSLIIADSDGGSNAEIMKQIIFNAVTSPTRLTAAGGWDVEVLYQLK
jgi:PKD repeat protein